MTKTGSTEDQPMKGGLTREQELVTDKLFAIGTKLGNSKSQTHFFKCCEIKNLHPESLNSKLLTIERKKYEEETRILSSKAKKLKDKLFTMLEKNSIDTVLTKFNYLVQSILSKNKIENDKKIEKLEQLQIKKDSLM